MDDRYKNKKIDGIWTSQNKLLLWQRSELAVLEARFNLSQLSWNVFGAIKKILNHHMIDLEWWKARDKEINHDLEAFLDERRRFLDQELVKKMIEDKFIEDVLPESLAPELHRKMTSYDTEEPAFSEMLRQSFVACAKLMPPLCDALKSLAVKYRYTPMLAVTHGQPAEIQSFGKRCLTWYKDINEAWRRVGMLADVLNYSKMSGMIGNYGGLEPVVEREALQIMGFCPYYGATQIMPRGSYSMFAQALCNVVMVIEKITLDIRLGARGGLAKAICQEPFGSKQKGSSRKPDKKNPITCEKDEGMARMAKGFADMIRDNVVTWEERAIEQSCVERVAWPDLFHVFCHAVENLTKMTSGLAVYPDHMMQEIVDNRGCYASGEAKEFIRDHFAVLGLSVEDAYRAVQLASFKVFAPNYKADKMRQIPPDSLDAADNIFHVFPIGSVESVKSIVGILQQGELESVPGLDASEEQITRLNKALRDVFKNPAMSREFEKLFMPSYWMRNEGILYQQILGV